MAQLTGVEFSTRQQCLEGFARTMGVFPPREPIPAWWPVFEKWYGEVRALAHLRKDDDPMMTSLMVRLEAFDYGDEAGEGDDDDEAYDPDWVGNEDDIRDLEDLEDDSDDDASGLIALRAAVAEANPTTFIYVPTQAAVEPDSQGLFVTERIGPMPADLRIYTLKGFFSTPRQVWKESPASVEWLFDLTRTDTMADLRDPAVFATLSAENAAVLRFFELR